MKREKSSEKMFFFQSIILTIQIETMLLTDIVDWKL